MRLLIFILFFCLFLTPQQASGKDASEYICISVEKNSQKTFKIPDMGNNSIIIEICKKPHNGIIFPNSLKKSITYMPKEGFVGTDSFSFRIIDDKGVSDISQCEVMVSKDVKMSKRQKIKQRMYGSRLL